VTKEHAYPFALLPRPFKRLVPGVQLIYCSDIDDLVRFARPPEIFLARRGQLVISIDSNGPITVLIGIEGKSPRFSKGRRASVVFHIPKPQSFLGLGLAV